MLTIIFAYGQAPVQAAEVVIFGITNLWRYEQTASLDGIPWQAKDFDDSTWPAGRGLLALEINSAVSPQLTQLVLGRTTYHFRTRFVIPSDVGVAAMTFSNLIDDGAVFHLNGVEIQRIRMPEAPTPVTYDTQATVSAPEAIFDTFTVSAAALTNVVPGTNVLAVEVHQFGSMSPDVVFGAALSITLLPQPPSFVQQPTGLVAEEGTTASFRVQVGGDPLPTLQWFKDGLPVPGSTNSTLLFPATRLDDAGTYFVRAVNGAGTNFSSNAVLTVTPDNIPPSGVTALANRNLTNILVTFSEPIAPVTGTNFEVFATGYPTQKLAPLAAIVTNTTNVLLTTVPRVFGIDYSLRATGIRDLSAAGNVILPATQPLRYDVELLGINSTTLWRYDQSGVDPGSGWQLSDFDDAEWPVGAPLFMVSLVSLTPPEPARTVLDLTNAARTEKVITYYFRTYFDIPGVLAPNTVRARHIVNDGVIVYFNGVESHSIRMGASRPSRYTDFANAFTGIRYEPPLNQPAFFIATETLTYGSNLVAAEVHQGSTQTIDAAFAFSLEATLDSFGPGLRILMPVATMEGQGLIPAGGRLLLKQVWPTDLTVALTSSDTTELTVPQLVTIPAGSTNVTFDLNVLDDLVLDGAQPVEVKATSLGVPPAVSTIIVGDNEPNTLSITLPGEVFEGGPSVNGSISFAQPAVENVQVTLTANPSNTVRIPATVLMPAGQTSVSFSFRAAEDRFIEGNQTATIQAIVSGWTSASGTLLARDNEQAMLSLVTPMEVKEGAGVVSNVFEIRLSGLATSNLTLALTSSDPSRLQTPGLVVVPSGSSNVLFSITVLDDSLSDGAHPVVVTAQAPGFSSTTNTVLVTDNDVNRFGFSLVPSPQRLGSNFPVSVTAYSGNGQVAAGFSGTATLKAVNAMGTIPAGPSVVGPFVNGLWTGPVHIDVRSLYVRLMTDDAPGESNPFHVEGPLSRFVTLNSTSDLLHDPVADTLVVSCPASAGPYANALTVIDPFAGEVLRTNAIGLAPGQMEISLGGQFLYVAISNRTALRRFDLGASQAGPPIGLGGNALDDFAVVAGAADTVATASSGPASNLAGLQVFVGGIQQSYAGLVGLMPTVLESSPVDGIIYASRNEADSSLNRLSLAGQGSVTLTSGPSSFSWPLGFSQREGVLYNPYGAAVGAESFTALGSYPGVFEGLVEVDPATRRVFYLVRRTIPGGTYELLAFDGNTFAQVASVPIANVGGNPLRLVLWGSSGLAFNTDSGRVWLIESGALRPPTTPADVTIS